MVAMHKLLVPANLRISVIGVLLLIPCLPSLPFLTIALLVISFGVLAVIGQSLSRWKRPELVLAYSSAAIQTMDAVAMAAAHIQRIGGLALLLWPLMSFNSRYPRRVAMVGTAFTAVLVVVTELAAGLHTITHDPLALTMPLAVVIAVATVTSVARESDVEHTRQAVLDPVTGLLNRSALAGRVRELAQQSTRAGAAVAVLIGDIDHFKSINDGYGHQAGDDVLRAVGDRLRGELRAFDLLYRVGGEEFVVLAPGATLQDGRELAERLRAAVSAEAVAGLPITISWGVSAASPETPFEWEPLYRAADRALYDAKAAGRDRVVCADALEAAEVHPPALRSAA